MDRSGGLNGGRCAHAVAFALALAATAPAAWSAPEPSGLDGALGIWDLSLEGSHRQCRITLQADPTGAGRTLRFPLLCRRALPILNGITAWSQDGRDIRLINESAEAVLSFAARDEDARTGASASGETYRLERPEGVVQPVRLAPAPPPIGVPQPTAIDPAKAPRPETIPGLYLVDRYSEREVCRLNLGRAMLTAAGRFEVRVLDGCRDMGLTAFDPVAWHYDGGRLTLTARRGHEVTLVSEHDGQWRRDPEVGATLILRKASGP
jgi:hypothetical protein